jgi:hypothetical protein
MPHLHIEVSRGVIERQLLSMPIEKDPSGATADILAPPVSIQDSSFISFSTIRAQIIIRTVRLLAIVGSANATVEMSFDESSIEILSLGKSVGLLSGHISASASMAVRQASGPDQKPIAQVGADLSNSIVTFHFDPPSQARISAEIPGAPIGTIESAIGAMLTKRFRAGGFQVSGLTFDLTPGVPSEMFLTAEALPTIVWVDAQTLAVAVSYALESSPPRFQPLPFLPDGPSRFGIRLSNDGFQRTVRNPAVGKLARDVLTSRRIDAFVHDAFVARGGVAPMTDADRADGSARLDAFLLTPAGLAELAGETPSPVEGGKLRKPVKAPDPFSDFDITVPELDLWLGEGRVEGLIVGEGDVDGFGFSARIRFRATPVVIEGQGLPLELRDFEIDDPEIDVDLPIWLEWATAILVGAISSALVGALVGYFMTAIIAALVESLIPSDLGAIIPAQKLAPRKLPRGVTMGQIKVTPDSLTLLGNWSVSLEDPRPFYPRAVLVDKVDRVKDGPETSGQADFICLAIFGVVIAAREGTGERFTFIRQAWHSSVVATVQTMAIPLPLTRFPWKVAVGYRTKEQYPAMPDAPTILVPGPLAVTASTWNPEPPFLGTVERRSFTINVAAVGADTFTFQVPAESGNILLELSTHVIDATGTNYDLLHYVDVPNKTLTFGGDFDDFAAKCRKTRRVLKVGKAPSLLDELWNPPNILVERVHEAIRNEEPAVTTVIAGVFASHGIKGLQALLAPSLASRVLTKGQQR